MVSKYYTPEIEEFHVGFEFEYKNHNSEWIKGNLDGNPIINRELDEFDDDLMKLAHAITRVKHLDREDIESLGWEFIKEYKEPGSYYLEFKQRHTELTLYPALEETMVFIEHESATGMFEGYPIFRGQIKNKSELKKLLKQLEI